MARTYKADAIADYLRDTENAAPHAASRAGTAIASAWSTRDFYASATHTPLRACATASPDMTAPITDVIDRLARHFDVFVHFLPAWDPAPPPDPKENRR